MFFVSVIVLYLSYLLGFVFCTVCLACGLYYIAEFVEEYSSIAKRVIRILILSVLFLHLLFLIFEDLPTTHILVGMLAHCIYYTLLKDFPFFEFTDFKFILCVIFVLLDHGLWFFHFTKAYVEFSEVVSFLSIMVWLVPFCYFLSLSANESTLPYGIISSSGEEVSAEDFTYPMGSKRRGKRTSTFLAVLNFLKRKKESILPSTGYASKTF